MSYRFDDVGFFQLPVITGISARGLVMDSSFRCLTGLAGVGSAEFRLGVVGRGSPGTMRVFPSSSSFPSGVQILEARIECYNPSVSILV